MTITTENMYTAPATEAEISTYKLWRAFRNLRNYVREQKGKTVQPVTILEEWLIPDRERRLQKQRSLDATIQ